MVSYLYLKKHHLFLLVVTILDLKLKASILKTKLEFVKWKGTPYWIVPSGHHLENRTWVRQNSDKAYFTIRPFLQPQIPTVLASSFRIVAILNLRLLSAILKYENLFIKIWFKHSMDNLNANHYALEQVFIVRTNLPLDFEWSPYWIGPSGRHLENRTWVRQNNDKAYSI